MNLSRLLTSAALRIPLMTLAEYRLFSLSTKKRNGTRCRVGNYGRKEIEHRFLIKVNATDN